MFDALGVAYLVGGSVARSFHGVPRLTNDADLHRQHVRGLVEALSPAFYVDSQRPWIATVP